MIFSFKQMSKSILVILFIFALTAHVNAQDVSPKIGVRGGLGTDINGGLAIGVGVNYLLDYPNGGLELGILYYAGSFEESNDIGMHTYDEKTDVGVFGLMANYLIGYDKNTQGTYFIVGVGLASISVEWEERSATDISLGTPLPGGGTMQSADATGAGSILNLGVGKNFESNFDLRFEIPTIVTFSAAGDASSVIPTFTISAGMRF